MATDLKSSADILRQAASSKTPMYCAVGISAPDVDGASGMWTEELKELAQNRAVVAIGETGYDGVNTSYPTIERQIGVFKQHIAIALELDLPLVLHSRGVDAEVLEMCIASGVKKALFHCYTGSEELVPLIMDAGYYVSLSGIVTFKNSGLDGVARAVRESRILIETDSPYLAPVPLRGSENVPNNVSYVGEYIAAVRDSEPAEFSTRVKKNFETLFDVSLR